MHSRHVGTYQLLSLVSVGRNLRHEKMYPEMTDLFYFSCAYIFSRNIVLHLRHEKMYPEIVSSYHHLHNTSHVTTHCKHSSLYRTAIQQVCIVNIVYTTVNILPRRTLFKCVCVTPDQYDNISTERPTFPFSKQNSKVIQ